MDLSALRANPDWSKLPLFDRKGWRRLPFGEFAQSLNERVEPSEAADEPYVGLDDLDPGDLHIRRWGKGSDVIGTKLRFRKGDIIFGRRRAYQRKLAVAEFDGICSAHAMVVRAKREIVLPTFLPFLMMSDRFMKRAVEISVGSLSPTINWTTLKLEEFDLPPLEQQERCVRLYSAADELIQKCLTTLKDLAEAADETGTKGFRGVNVSVPGASNSLRLGEVFKVVTGGTPSRSNPAYWNGSIPWVKTGEVNYEDITETEEKISETAIKDSAAKLVPPDSILIAMYGQGPTLGRVAHLRIPATTNQACAAICPSAKMVARYVYHYLRKEYSNIRKLARGASQPNINLQIVKDLWIPSATLEEQKSVAAELDAFVSPTANFEHHVDQTRKQVFALSNALFT